MTCIVNFKCGDDTATVSVKDPQCDITDFIEEQLYILWELTPSNRDWKSFFFKFGHAFFDYHNCEHFTMELRKLKTDGSAWEVIVKEFGKLI